MRPPDAEPVEAAPSPLVSLGRRLVTFLTRRRPIHQALLIVLSLALVPLAILAAILGVDRLLSDVRRANQELGAAVLQAASPQMNPLHRVQPLVALLDSHPAIRAGRTEECASLLHAAGEMLGPYVKLVALDEKGRVRCGGEAGRQMTAGELWRMPRSGPPASGPYVVALVDLAKLANSIEPPQRQRGAFSLLADGSGRILAGKAPAGLDPLPLGPEAGQPGSLVNAVGERWAWSHAPLHSAERAEDSLHLVFVRPWMGGLAGDWWFFASSFALPLAALLLTSVAIWVGANHSILRWVTELRGITGLIGEGNYRLPAERFEEAPLEIRALAADAQRMARTIAERDRTLTEALERQKALTLELNHRVRNNLQLISSYLTLRAGNAGQAEIGPLRELRLRVGALTLVHRLLYRDFERAAVRADVLLQGLVELVATEFETQALTVDAPPVAVGIDSAVPLALCVVEVGAWLREPECLGCRLQSLSLRLAQGEAALHFEVETDARSARDLPEPPRLLTAFARQLGGRFLTVEDDSGRISLCLIFPESRLDQAFHPNVGTIRNAGG